MVPQKLTSLALNVDRISADKQNVLKLSKRWKKRKCIYGDKLVMYRLFKINI